MALILYLPDKNEAGAHLRMIIKGAIQKQKIETYHSIRQLSERLQKPIYDVKVAVFYAASREHLKAIIGLSDFLWDLKIILVLPDSDPITVTKAHMLRPRYVTWADEDFKDLGNVLNNLMELYDPS
jgi:hypothetical protein